jgi:hypothetical protein
VRTTPGLGLADTMSDGAFAQKMKRTDGSTSHPTTNRSASSYVVNAYTVAKETFRGFHYSIGTRSNSCQRKKNKIRYSPETKTKYAQELRKVEFHIARIHGIQKLAHNFMDIALRKPI